MEKTAVSMASAMNVKEHLNKWREERKQKLVSRLLKNQPAKSSLLQSYDALTGTLKSKTSNTMKTNISKSTLPTQEVTDPEEKKPVFRKLSFRQTATSLRRANMATMGIQTIRKEVVKTGEQPASSIKVPLSAVPSKTPLRKLAFPTQQKPSLSNLSRKLTLPQSPNFSARLKQRSLPKPATTRPPVKPKTVTTKVPVQLKKEPAAEDTTDSRTNQSEMKKKPTISAPFASKRPTSTWMMPLTSDVKAAAKMQHPSPRTPKVKTFTRKSFSDVKVPQAAPRHSQMPRWNSTVTFDNSRSSIVPRRSVAFTAGNESSSRNSRSLWNIQKEPSEKEKIQNWLEKRGRSITSCRHLGCLGHKLEDFNKQEQQPKSSVRKSIKTVKVVQDKKEEEATSASPEMKRKSSTSSSLMNTTFEKEDEDKENVQPLKVEEAQEQAVIAACDEVEDKFHTPAEPKDQVPELVNVSSEVHIEKLLQSILELSQEVNYSEDKIDSWLQKSSQTFPVVKTHALFWEIKARLAERQGNTYVALDVYNEAVQNKAEPLEMMDQLFNDFLQRVGADIPTGQRTPLLKSLGLATPAATRGRTSRINTPRRPHLDASNVFDSSVIKYEVKLKKIFQALEDKLKMTGATPRKSMMRVGTPMKKVTSSSAMLSVTSEDEAFQLVATPVRRSMRPKSMHLLARVQENDQVLYVDDLDQLSPTTKGKVELRLNSALRLE